MKTTGTLLFAAISIGAFFLLHGARDWHGIKREATVEVGSRSVPDFKVIDPPLISKPVPTLPSIGTDSAHTSDGDVIGVVGSYTVEDLQAALDDYFNVDGSPESPNPEYLRKLQDAFDLKDIPTIDATVSNFLFDNGISRQAKLATLWTLITQPGNDSARMEYLLSTIESLKPIEKTEDLIQLYKGCVEDECSKRILSVLLEAAFIPSVGYGKLSSSQLQFIESKNVQIRDLIRSEISTTRGEGIFKHIASQLPVLFTRDETLAAIEDVIATDPQKGEALMAAYAGIVIGSPEVDAAVLSSTLDRIAKMSDEKQKREALDTVYSALRDIPINKESLSTYKSFLEKNEPNDRIGIEYVEWLSAYSIVCESGDPSTQKSKVFLDRLLHGTIQARVSLVIYGGDLVRELSERQRQEVLKSIMEGYSLLPPEAEERKAYKAAIGSLGGKIN